MADIKTRDVTRGTIKTIDRAASSMHHLKEETIRSKALNVSSSHDSEPAGSYAQDIMGYSDDVINDAFDEDPDAYWNID
jgi:hypothetical protein